MAFKPLATLDLNDYFDALAVKAGATMTTTDTICGITVYLSRFVYHDASDRFIMTATRAGGMCGIAVDPAFLDSDASNIPPGAGSSSIYQAEGFAVSQRDPATGAQKIYRARAGGGSDGRLVEVSLTNLSNPTVLDPFPNFDLNVGGTGGQPGYCSGRSCGIVFNGLTDGIPGSAQSSGFVGTKQVGTNVYPSGLWLGYHDGGNLHSTFDFKTSIGWHDISTGKLVGGSVFLVVPQPRQLSRSTSRRLKALHSPGRYRSTCRTPMRHCPDRRDG